MSTSRRDFLKTTTIIAGAGASLPLRSFASSATGAGSSAQASAQESVPVTGPAAYTRGIGHYPGAPGENFSPTLTLDSTTYRNLALLRPAYHSSSYDYNLTAQLVTDGIKDTHLPTWVSTSVDGIGILTKQDREVFLDHSSTNTLELKGHNPAVQIQLGGGETVAAIDRVAVFIVVPDNVDPATLSIVISTSDDGRVWKRVGTSSALAALAPGELPARPGRRFAPLLSLRSRCNSSASPASTRCNTTRRRPFPGRQNSGSGVQARSPFIKESSALSSAGPYTFTSAWMSAGLSEEWVYVDLGARCTFDRITLTWIARAAEGSIQLSDDAAGLAPSAAISPIRLRWLTTYGCRLRSRRDMCAC